MRAGTAIARSPAPRRLSNSPAAGGSSITGRGLPLPARRKAAADSGDSATVMERKVFEAFFTLTINFITAGPLTMEKFTAQKQSLIHTECVALPLPIHFAPTTGSPSLAVCWLLCAPGTVTCVCP